MDFLEDFTLIHYIPIDRHCLTLTYTWWEESQEILCSVELLQSRHPAQIIRQFFYLIVVQLQGDAVGQRFKRLRYLLNNVNLVSQALKNAHPWDMGWEQLG